MDKTERDIIIEVAQDVKWFKKQQEENSRWLQKSLDKIELHLVKLNDNVSKNTSEINVNASSINRVWWFLGIIIVTITGIIVKVAVF